MTENSTVSVAKTHNRKQFQTVSDGFQTEQSAIGIFLQVMPSRWIPRPQQPDFHIDYLVEITEAGELTGTHIGVQLKGWQPKKNYKSSPKYSLKTKHLAYYLKCNHPIFLVLVDVTNRKAFWKFMQQFGKERDQSWRKQEKVTVDFNQADDLENHKAFVDAVTSAKKYVSDLHPSSVEAAVKGLKESLESKDPRVSVQVNVINGSQHITLNPKETFKFKMKFKTSNPATIRAITDFLDKGADLSIQKSEVEIVGAPLLAQVNSGDGELLIQQKRNIQGAVVLSWDDVNGGSQVHVPAIYRAGLKYATCEASFPRAPLKLVAAIGPMQWDKNDPFNMEFVFRPQEWEGQQLAILPYFETVFELIKAIAFGSEISLKFLIEGNLLGRARLNDRLASEVSGMMDFLEMLRKARILGRHFGKSIALPPLKKLHDSEYTTIDELFGVVFERSYRKPVPSIRLSNTLYEPLPKDFQCGTPSSLILKTSHADYPILGEVIRIGPLELEFTEMVLQEPKVTGLGGGVKVEFHGSENSEQVVRLTNE